LQYAGLRCTPNDPVVDSVDTRQDGATSLDDSAPVNGASQAGPRGSEGGQVLADVSNAIVRIHKRFYGKGPVKARAHLSQDLLTVVLEGGFTRGEQTLHDHGHAQEVIRSRLAMQESIENEFRAAVESILYRSVRSFMSANDPSHDLQAEIFVLHPRGSETLADEPAALTSNNA
jgi:uncharacterized protein YbcI